MMFALKILIEIAVVLLIAYGTYHEDELIEFEQIMCHWARNGFKVYKEGK